MKRIFNISLAAFALVAISMSCNKEIGNPDEILNPDKQKEQVNPAAKTITITATLSDATTKVSFDPVFGGTDDHKPTSMAHNWQAGDQLRVTDSDDTSNTQIFELVDGAGKATGKFSGTALSGTPASYVVEVIPAGTPSEGNTQNQAKDGDTAHLKYVATATDVTDLNNFILSETSAIIGIIAKLPENVAVTVNKLEIEKSTDDFVTSEKLTINLTTSEDVNNDDVLEVYANIPTGWTIAAGTKMFLRFGSTNTNHTVYTRYQEFAAAPTITAGAFNYIKMNCAHIDQYAGKDDAGSSTAPYLIADKYQLLAVDGLMNAGETKYFKLIDNVDMNGETWTALNQPSPYDRGINFNGNNKTISNVGTSMFYVIKGSVYDLTLDKCDVTARGILAEYIQGAGNIVSNVTVSNGKVDSSSSNVGGLIGQINNGSSGQTTATITDCIVTNTDVKGAGVVGGFVGFANELVSISGCKYTGGTVESSARYCGGFLGSTANQASVISNCQVEDATVKSTHTDDARCGGFVGQLQTTVQIKGCTVGTELKKVVVETALPASGKVLNAGGFVGVNYGTISKNGVVRSKAYVNVTSANNLGQQINVGGFVGFHRGTIEYCDAVVDMSELQGQYIGGFSGYMMNADSKADNCTLKGSVRGNNYTGGFVGVVDNTGGITNCQVLEGTIVVGQSTAGGFAAQIKAGTVEDCSAHVNLQCRGGNDGGFVGALTGGTVQRCSSAGTLSRISGSNTVFGGFAGYVNGVNLTKCSSTVNITVASQYVGGLVGHFQTANMVSECFYNGTISGPANTKGGLIGMTSAVAVVITNCYTAGELIGSSGTQIYGGIVGELQTGGSVTNCYSTMDMTHGGRAMGGIVGRACSGGWPVSNASGNTVSKCIAWNPNIIYDGTAGTSASSGAIIGYTSFKNILNNCYRRYDMVYKNSNTAVGTSCQTSMVDQVDCDGTNWAINGNRPAGGTPAGTSADAQYQAPYYGVAAASNATVSSIAQTLGWSADVWDFTGDLPTLK